MGAAGHSVSEFLNVTRVHDDYFAIVITERFFKLLRCSLQHAEGSVVYGNDRFGFEQIDHRISGMDGVHGKMPADRQQGDIGFVLGTNESHIAKNACVPGMINFETVFQLDDVAGRLPTGIDRLFASGGVFMGDG